MNFEDLDKLFRQKLSQKRAEFDEGAWSEMEEILNRRGRSRRPAGWWFVLPLLLVSVIGGYFVLEERPTLNNKATSQANQAITDTQHRSADGMANDDPASAVSPLLFVSIKDHPEVAKTNNANDLTNSSASNPSKVGRSDHSSPSNSQSPNLSVQTNAQTNSGKTSNAQAVQKPDNHKRYQGQNQFDIPDRSLEVEGKKERSSQVALTKLPTIGARLKQQHLSPEEAQTLVDSLRSEVDIRETFAYGITGGAQFTPNSGNNTFNSLSPEPLIGAYGRWHLGADWFLNAELLYHFDQSPDYQETVTDRDYQFGFEATSTTISLEQVHYLEFPVYVDYELFGSHGITGGVKGSWLITGSGKLTKKQFSSFGNQASSTENAQINPDDLKTWQVQGMLGYRFDYNDKLTLQLRGLFGPGQVKQSASDDGVAQNSNIGVQLMLQYQLN